MSDWLGMLARPKAARPEMRARVLAHAIGARRRPRRLPWIAAAAVLAGVAVGALWVRRTVQERDGLRGDLARAEAALRAYQDTMAVIRGPGTRAVQIPVSTNGQVGAITIFDDTTTHRWVVTCHNLAANQPGQAYQLWFITDQGPRSAALMPMDSSRPMMLTLEMPKGSVRVMGAAMSIEPAAGSNGPTGPIVFRFTL